MTCGGTSEDLALRVTFGEPDEHGRQQVQVRRANGPAARHGTVGVLLGEGRSGELFSLEGDGLAWAGLAADPSTGDGVALGMFLQGLSEGRLAGSPIASSSAPPQATPTFPYLSPPRPATLPALVDLYLRQPQAAGQ